MSEAKNIYQRLQAVMKEVSYLRREKRVDTYMAVTHDQVTAEVRPWFLAHGIVIVPTLGHSQTVDTGSKSSKNTPMIRFESTWSVRFVNVDKPEDFVEVLVASHANDYGDKAPGKALSYAVKAAILKVLMIETGENDESRVAAEVPAESIVEYEARIDEAVSPEEVKAILAEALEEARDCQDHYAARRLKRYATKKGGQFNEFMPSATKAGPVADGSQAGEVIAPSTPRDAAEPAPAKPAPRAPLGDKKVATPGMVTTVKKAMERTGKTEEQLLEKFGCDVSSIPADKINEVIGWARS